MRNFQSQINLFKGTGRESLQTVESITPGIRELTYVDGYSLWFIALIIGNLGREITRTRRESLHDL